MTPLRQHHANSHCSGIATMRASMDLIRNTEPDKGSTPTAHSDRFLTSPTLKWCLDKQYSLYNLLNSNRISWIPARNHTCRPASRPSLEALSTPPVFSLFCAGGRPRRAGTSGAAPPLISWTSWSS